MVELEGGPVKKAWPGLRRRGELGLGDAIGIKLGLDYAHFLSYATLVSYGAYAIFQNPINMWKQGQKSHNH